MSDAFGRWLLSVLEERGWSRSTLATRMGVHPGTVARWVSGKTRITPENCYRVAEALGMPPDVVLHAAGYEPKQHTPRKQTARAVVQAAMDVGWRYGLSPDDLQVLREALEWFERRIEEDGKTGHTGTD
jgi:transcriptional regulator with XRE-family HTH domain